MNKKRVCSIIGHKSRDILQVKASKQHLSELKKLISQELQKLLDEDVFTYLCGMDIRIKKPAGRTPRLYKLVDRDFNLTDLKLLIDAVQSSEFIKTPKDKELIQKLSSLTSKYQATQLE